MSLNMAEIIGYLASVLVALSIMMVRMVRLRILNMSGAAAFAIYGFMIGSNPVIITNIVLTGINLWFLVKLIRNKEQFSLIQTDAESPFFRLFYRQYESDIQRFFPELNPSFPGHAEITLVFRNSALSGIMVCEAQQKTIRILMDYVTPGFRDFKNSKFLYEKKIREFSGRGFWKIIARSYDPSHQKYLKRAGFEKDASDDTLFEMILKKDK